MKVVNTFKKINSFTQYISGVALMVLMFMTVIDVFVRKVLGRPLSGVYELTPICLTIIVFFAVAYAHDHREHVVIDVLYEALPRVGKKVFSYISIILTLAIVCLMCYVVFDYAIQIKGRGATTSILHIPMWPVAILASLGMLGYVLALIGDLIYLIKGGVLSNEPS